MHDISWKCFIYWIFFGIKIIILIFTFLRSLYRKIFRKLSACRRCDYHRNSHSGFDGIIIFLKFNLWWQEKECWYVCKNRCEINFCRKKSENLSLLWVFKPPTVESHIHIKKSRNNVARKRAIVGITNIWNREWTNQQIQSIVTRS